MDIAYHNSSPQQQGIIVSRSRDRAIAYVVLYASLLTVAISLLLLYIWIVGDALTKSTYSNFLVMITLVSISCTIWATWHIVTRQLLVSDPLMLITQDGIYINKQPFASSQVFIAWNEVAVIYTSHVFFQRVLCIRPKNSSHYLSQFGYWKRLSLFIDLLISGAPLLLRQGWALQSTNETYTKSVSSMLKKCRSMASNSRKS